MSLEYQDIGDHRLYCGDCLDVLSTLSSISAVVTDPPYAIPTVVASGRKITRNVGDLSIVEGAFRQHIGLWKTAIKEQGRIFVFCDGASYPVIYRAAYGAFNLACLVWDKQKIGMGREFRKRHELIIHGWGAQTPVVSSDGTGYADIIACSPVPTRSREHPAQKPASLLKALLRVCGSTVLDPFMGVGSVGVACQATGRRFVGIEIDPRYFDLACKKIEKAVKMTC